METITIEMAQRALKQTFGYEGFRLAQKDIIENVIKKNDTLALMPTGGGKSMCFQIPALLFEGLTVVISPLIALMKDQVDALKINGIDAAFLNSTLTNGEEAVLRQELKQGQIRLIYIAPERLFSRGSEFLIFLQQLNVSLFAIDEAHCISQWGHDFRPEYLKLSILKKKFEKVPVIALTATADARTQKDILEKLQLTNPQVFISSFNRANIHYYVEPKQDSKDKLVTFLNDRKDETGIIYTLSRKSTESIANELNQLGFDARPYHAGLSKAERDNNQELFINDKIKIVVATIAFGMGIDKSNVRYVVHMDLPKNIEGYYQETGRAGRDGLKSDALLFFSRGDALKLKRFVQIEDDPEQSKIMLHKLNQMVHYSETTKCRRQYLLAYFNEQHDGDCKSCDVCLTQHETFDGTIIAQKALSAIYRLKETFGTGYVIDFLRGSKSAKIRDWHKDIRTYGAGKDISKKDWQLYIRNIVDLGYLRIDDGEFPILKLTAKSLTVLRGEEQVQLIKHKSRLVSQDEALPYETVLLKQLKELRYQIASTEGVPPYLVFADNTLLELSTYLPHSITEIEAISGFGEIKVKKYGPRFLDEVVMYCNANKLVSRMSQKKIKRVRKSKSNGKSRTDVTTETQATTFKLFNNGASVNEIAEIREFTLSTIETHLAHFIEKGELALNRIVVDKKADVIRKILGDGKTAGIGDVRRALGNSYSYGEIKAVLSAIQFEKKQKK